MSALASTSSFIGNTCAFKKSAQKTRKEVLVTPMSALRGRSLQNTPEGVSIDKKGADFFNKTYYPKAEDVDNSRKPWVVVDATDLRHSVVNGRDELRVEKEQAHVALEEEEGIEKAIRPFAKKASRQAAGSKSGGEGAEESVCLGLTHVLRQPALKAQ